MPLQELNEPQKEKKKNRHIFVKVVDCCHGLMQGKKNVEYTLTALFLSRPKQRIKHNATPATSVQAPLSLTCGPLKGKVNSQPSCFVKLTFPK